MRALVLFSAILMTVMNGFAAVLSGHAMFTAMHAGHPDDWAFYRTIIYLTIMSGTLTLTIARARKL